MLIIIICLCLALYIVFISYYCSVIVAIHWHCGRYSVSSSIALWQSQDHIPLRRAVKMWGQTPWAASALTHCPFHKKTNRLIVLEPLWSNSLFRSKICKPKVLYCFFCRGLEIMKLSSDPDTGALTVDRLLHFRRMNHIHN